MSELASTLTHELEAALANGSAARRAVTLRRVTDLFLAAAERYDDAQIALFDDVIGRLAQTIEHSARILLAERLAPVPNAPPRVVRELAEDDSIDVARPVLWLSTRLGDDTLVATAKTKSQDHLLAISRRQAISAAVTDILVSRGDPQVVQSTAENAGASFSQSGLLALVERAKGDDRLALSVGTRSEIPPHILRRLVAAASEQARSKLVAAHPHLSSAIEDAVTQSAQDVGNLIQELQAAEQPAIDARERVQTLYDAGRLDEAAVESFAASGQFKETAFALSLLCDLSAAGVEKAMTYDRFETVLMFVRAVGLSWQTAREILRLCVASRGITPKELESNYQNFERLKQPTAKRALQFHRVRDRLSTTLH